MKASVGRWDTEKRIREEAVGRWNAEKRVRQEELAHSLKTRRATSLFSLSEDLTTTSVYGQKSSTTNSLESTWEVVDSERIAELEETI